MIVGDDEGHYSSKESEKAVKKKLLLVSLFSDNHSLFTLTPK
jgi:hypothetical protein